MFVLAALVLSAMLGGTRGLATTLVVDDDGRECPGAAFTTIQAAVDMAATGDVIQVCAGVYPELVTVNKTLTVRGAQAGADARTRAGVFGESVVIGNAGSTSFHVTAGNVTIDGFIMQNAVKTHHLGAAVVLAPGTSGTLLLNNIIQNNSVGVYLANASSPPTVVARNLFRANSAPGATAGTGIYSDQVVAGGTLTNVVIESNAFVGNSDSGISLASTQAGSQSRITISNNDFDGNGRALVAFNLTSSTITSNRIRNSTLTNSADLGFFEGVTNVLVSCNDIVGSGTPMRGIRVSNRGRGSAPSSAITLDNNSISGYGQAGLEVDAGAYVGVFKADNNWWGSPTGPIHPSNPGGTGKAIVDSAEVVNFKPWRTTVAVCGAARACDINADGQVDSDDLAAITAARGTTVVHGDPRDADGDGRITVNDVRVCTLGYGDFATVDMLLAGLDSSALGDLEPDVVVEQTFRAPSDVPVGPFLGGPANSSPVPSFFSEPTDLGGGAPLSSVEPAPLEPEPSVPPTLPFTTSGDGLGPLTSADVIPGDAEGDGLTPLPSLQSSPAADAVGVPEPATWSLIAAGLGGLLTVPLWRRRTSRR